MVFLMPLPIELSTEQVRLHRPTGSDEHDCTEVEGGSISPDLPHRALRLSHCSKVWTGC